MKKILSILALILLATLTFAQETTSDTTASSREIGTNIFGIFTGSYTIYGDFSLNRRGFLSLGGRATWGSSSWFGADTTSLNLRGWLRLYPATNRNGGFLYVSSGIDSTTYTHTTISSVPLVAGLGWKWVINDFAFDLYFGAGRQTWLGNADFLNSIPLLNYAVDGGLLVGYRF